MNNLILKIVGLETLFTTRYKGSYKKTNVCTVLLITLMANVFISFAQMPRKGGGTDASANFMRLKPGDKIPDAVWNMPLELNSFDGEKKKIKLADLREKIILLDFWATTCPSCIENIPHMEEIQERYRNDVTVLLVNSKRNKDTPDRIKKVLERYKDKYNYNIQLSTILDDSLLTTLFPHNTIPNITWINKDGIFLGNTLPNEVSIKNIERILQGKKADLQVRGEFRNKDNVMKTPPIFDTTGTKFLSAITAYLPYYLPTYPNLISENGNSRYQMVNRAFNFMMANAFKKELKGFESTEYVYEDGLGAEIKTKLVNGANHINQYCYQLFVNDTISLDQAENYFQEAFKANFRINVERRKGTVSFYSLEINEHVANLKSRGNMPKINTDPEEGPIYFQNFPLVTLLSVLHLYLDKPVSFGQIENMDIDITFPEGYERMSVGERLRFLASKGIRLRLVSQEREYPYFYSIN